MHGLLNKLLSTLDPYQKLLLTKIDLIESRIERGNHLRDDFAKLAYLEREEKIIEDIQDNLRNLNANNYFSDF